MKKNICILAFAAIAMTFSACVKEDVLDAPQRPVGEERTFTVSFEGCDDEDTRTDITKQGKTVWATGDQLLVTNGTDADTVTVPASANGQKYFDFSTTVTGTIYVVYPVRAYQNMTSDKKLVLNVPRIQDGTFGSANIAVAVASDRKVKMRNVTSVLKFRVPSSVTTPIKVVSINSVGNNVAGTFSVDMASGNPVVATPDTLQIDETTKLATSYSGDAVVKVDGVAGSNFYATVIPGTYTKGFSMTAVTLDLDHASESKTTVSDKALGVNELFDLGSIGTDLKPMGGTGTQSDPYVITNFPEYLVFTYYVNEGNSMRDKYVKVTSDISGITTPVGIWDEADDAEDYPFQGNFDGGGHTFTVNMKQDGKLSLGLFSYVSDSARISNVKVAGSITTTYKNTGGIAGLVSCSTEAGAIFKNCSSSATVKTRENSGGLAGWVGNGYKGSDFSIKFIDCSFTGSLEGSNSIGGIAGQTQYTEFRNCSNSGSVTGTYTVGGIQGYGYQGLLTTCKNSGSITATADADVFYCYKSYKVVAKGGAAGIVSWSQNLNLKYCTNEGNISGVSKNGGIAGTIYWGSYYNCVNRGAVTGSGQGAGGIVGQIMNQGRLYGCENYGSIHTDTYQAAGIAAFAVSQSQPIWIYKCTNYGKASAGGNCAGGIVGYTENNNANNKLLIDRCINAKDADITAPTAVGGILGTKQDYYRYCLTEIMNSENHAKVTGTAANDGMIGGIFGGAWRTVSNSQQFLGIRIWNCYNDGDVVYTNTAGTQKIGGIVGYFAGGEVWNCYNGGRVGNADPSATLAKRDSTRCGALVGHSAYARNVSGYYLAGVCALPKGAQAAINNRGIYAADATGALSEVVTIGSVGYSNVVDALNAGIGTQTQYYHWVAGPKFDYGTLTDPVDGGGFDIGDGGEI